MRRIKIKFTFTFIELKFPVKIYNFTGNGKIYYYSLSWQKVRIKITKIKKEDRWDNKKIKEIRGEKKYKIFLCAVEDLGGWKIKKHIFLYIPFLGYIGRWSNGILILRIKF